MTARTAQTLLASVFFILGGWCLVAPNMVMSLAFTPAYQSDAPIVPILVACFGAQAVLAGVFAAFSEFTRRTFLAYGIALLPFFLFDYWFYAVEPMLTEVGLLDAAGNVIMLWLCWVGWKRAGEVSRRVTGSDLLFQLFALLLGFAVAELLAGLARTWRIRVGATRTGEAEIRIGWLVPLLALLVLSDQTHFWLAAFELRTHVAFDYATLLGVLAIIGGYYIVSTFVFPDDPAHWPDFDEYYLRTNRTVVGGMLAINLVTLIYGAYASSGLPLADAPLARSWISIAAATLFLPGLVALWFVKSRRANLCLLIAMNLLLLVGAAGPKMFDF